MSKYKDSLNFVDHDFATTTVTINGTHVVQGLHSVAVEFDEDENSIFTVGDGTGQFVKSQVRSGTIKLGILEASATTDALETLRTADSQFSFGITDSNVSDLKATASKCKFQKRPVLIRGKEPEVVEWTFVTPYLQCKGGSYTAVTA